MHSTRRILPFTNLFLLLVFNEMLFSNSNYVPALDNGQYAITCLPKPPQSLTFITALDETFLLNRTQTSVEVLTIAKTIGRVTGGIFGDDIYKFDKFILYWNTPKSECCESYNDSNFLMARVIYANIKYKTTDEASRYPDGIIDVLVPVEANAPIDNPAFSPFEKIFKENLAYPGDQIKINSGSTYTWFDHFGPSSVYKIFKGSFYDTATVTNYPCTTIAELPSSSQANFISCKQYADTFGSMRDSYGDTLNNPLPKITPLTAPTPQCGITVMNIKTL